MRTEAEFLTQLVAGELHCPCDRKCIAKPLNLPAAFKVMPITWEHKSYEAYMACLTRYVRNEVFDALKGLMSRGGKSAGYPQTGYILIEQKVDPEIFEKPIRELQIHFASTNSELDMMIARHLFMICELAVAELH